MIKNEVKSFGVMAKPTGPICNLDCSYCFYLEKEKLYPEKSGVHSGDKGFIMPFNVLESFIWQQIEAQDVDTISFIWQEGNRP